MKPFLIAEPCTESWDAMRIEAGGCARHCAACERHVVDLSQLTEAQIRGLFTLAPGGFCGRQLIRDGLLATRPEPAAKSRWPVRLTLGGAVLASALAGCAPAAAADPGPTPIVVATTPEPGTPSEPVPPKEAEPIAPAPDDRPEIEMGKVAPPRSFSEAHVSFARGSAKLTKDELAKLDDVAAALEANLWWITSVAIEGHVGRDEVPAERSNKLAMARAAAVRDALVKRGVDPKRLQITSFGASRPIASGEAAVANQRVELRAI